MKKVLFLLLLFVLCFSLCACSEGGTPVPDGGEAAVSGECDFPEIPEEVVRGIRQAYYDAYASLEGRYTPNDVEIQAFYGEYHGVYAILLHCPAFLYMDAIVEHRVNGLNFIYPSSQGISLYCDGQLYGAQSAFEAGVLSAEDLERLYGDYKATRPYLYVEEDLRMACYDRMIRGTAREEILSPDDLRISLLGEFSTGTAFVVEGVSAVYPERTEETVGGFAFRYDTDLRVSFYDGTEFYSLQSAYEKGLVNQASLRAIRKAHSMYFPLPYQQDWVPVEKSEYTASWEKEVRQAYFEMFAESLRMDGYTAEDLTVTCYGTYTSGYAVSVSEPSRNYPPELWEAWRDDLCFLSWDGEPLWFYREGKLTAALSENIAMSDGEWKLLYESYRSAHPEYYAAQDLCQAYYDRYIKGTAAEQEIRRDSLYLSAYYEENGCVAGIVKGPWDPEPKEWHEVAGTYLFRYDTEDRIYFLQDGQIYSLDELGKNGLSFEGDLENLHRWHTLCFPDLYGSPVTGECSAVLDAEIRQAYYDKYVAGTGNEKYFSVDDLSVRYFGEFEGNHALSVSGLPTTDEVRTVVIDGFRFSYGGVSIYRNGVFYGLNQAREEGLLSREGLLRLHAAYFRS